MEQRGSDPHQNVTAIIPARYGSVRLPGKMLREIAGKPLILHTLGQALKARRVDRVIVATNDEQIAAVVRLGGGEAVVTSSEHNTGSDRIAEVAESLPTGSIIVNVQGDEPMISPDTIDRAVEALINDPQAQISTTFEPLKSVHGELLNGNIVKVVAGDNGYALYFSRSPMPFPRDASLRYGGDPGRAIENEPELMANFRKHTGLYAYRREYLLRFTRLPQTRLELIESLEQIRALEDGAKIRLVESAAPSIGVDTESDLARVKILLEEMPVTIREADRDDIPEIARVYVDSVKSSFACIYPEGYLEGLTVEHREQVANERFAGSNYCVFVAVSLTGKIVGFIDCGVPILDEVDHERQIYSLYLLQEYQRMEIGRSLFDACVSGLSADGVASVCLDTVADSPYRRFYDRMGGKEIRRGSHRFGDDEMATVIYGWRGLKKI